MPPLSRPSIIQKETLSSRQAIVAAETDVLVVGGGPAGLGAALGAAKAGAEVILAEKYGFLGGNATAALVMPLMSFHTDFYSRENLGSKSLFPSDHGPGDPVIAGALKEFLERLIINKGAITPSHETGYVVPFDPEIFKATALEMLDEAGVKFMFHVYANEIYTRDRVPQGVVFASKSGPILIKAQCMVDATGDGDIAAIAGAEFEIGRPDDHLVQPMTLMFRMINFDQQAFENYVTQNPNDWLGVHGLWSLVKKATDAGKLHLKREDILFFATPHEGEVSVNCTRVTKVLGTDIWDLTYAEWSSRQQMMEIVAFLKQFVPGFKKSYPIQSGVQIGVRESRRILGEYRLTASDLLEARKFPDVIARGSYPLDIHNPQGPGTTLKRLPPGESYDIPLRSLIPKGIENIVLSGRCISGTHEAHSSYRTMPISMATGQAAGVAAALSAAKDRPIRSLAIHEIHRELSRQGANLGPKIRENLPMTSHRNHLTQKGFE